MKKSFRFKSLVKKDSQSLPLFDYIILNNNLATFEKVLEHTLLETNKENYDILFIILDYGNINFLKKPIEFFFGREYAKIFDFFMNHNVLMILAEKGREDFIIDLVNEYLVPYGKMKTVPDNKLRFTFIKKNISLKNINIFHLIAEYKMSKLFYILMDYFVTYKCEGDPKRMKNFIEDMFMSKCEMIGSIGEINFFTVMDVALKHKFYEIISICDFYEIKLAKTEKDFSNSKVYMLNILTNLDYFSRFSLKNELLDLKSIKEDNFFGSKFKKDFQLYKKLRKYVIIDKEKISVNNRTFPTSLYFIEALVFGRSLLKDVLYTSFMEEIMSEFKKSNSILLWIFLNLGIPGNVSLDLKTLIYFKNEIFIFSILDKLSFYKIPNDTINRPHNIAQILAQNKLLVIIFKNFFLNKF